MLRFLETRSTPNSSATSTLPHRPDATEALPGYSESLPRNFDKLTQLKGDHLMKDHGLPRHLPALLGRLPASRIETTLFTIAALSSYSACKLGAKWPSFTVRRFFVERRRKLASGPKRSQRPNEINHEGVKMAMAQSILSCGRAAHEENSEYRLPNKGPSAREHVPAPKDGGRIPPAFSGTPRITLNKMRRDDSVSACFRRGD